MRHGTIIAAGIGLLFLSGCMSGPLRENPLLLGPAPAAGLDNPVYLPQGPSSYGAVFGKVLDTVDDFFPIAYANRYGGEIQTHPVISGGLLEPWKTSSPDVLLKLRATTQTIRHRALVTIQPDKQGGYFVDVRVLMELEDLARPTTATAGDATFLTVATIERQYEVVEQARFDNTWIPIGRDTALEQLILSRIVCPTPPHPWADWLNANTGEPTPVANR